MKKISKEQIKIIFSIAAKAGLVDNSKGHEDELHQIVFSTTNKESVKELTYAEYLNVKKHIEEYMTNKNDSSDMITSKQKGKIFVMMKKLAEIDPSEKSIEERLCGIINKTIKNVSAFPNEPLRWIRKKDAAKLIQIIGFYTANEEKKRDSKGVNDDEHKQCHN